MPTTLSTDAPVRLAMLGMIEGNGHPYSWSAIVNGFNATAMAECPYPVIARYLGAQPAGSVGVAGARVTHLWTDDPDDALAVASASLIPQILRSPEEAIGQVDAVMIATDDGYDHVRRARPFLKAGLPVFVDKPLALTVDDLRFFHGAQQAGARVLSSSGLRYSPELDSLLAAPGKLGEWRWISGLTCKSWERYGIHVLEPVFRLLGPGFESVRLESRPGLEVAHLHHCSGVQVSLPVIADGGATFGTLHIAGTAGQETLRLADTYTAFRRQILEFVNYVRTGATSYPFSHTVEISALLIAGLRSRAENGRRVELAEINALIQ